jgi:hypothetical protein
MSIFDYAMSLLQGGLGNLGAYLAAHVLLCLLPAFFIAGALTALVPDGTVTRYLGRKAPKWISYPAAALGGFVLAVCSCTIMPLFAGIYKKGAGLGPAITFLFVGPAINILALAYTGVALGMDIAIARVILAVIFGIGIGLIMALLFRRDEAARASDQDLGAASSGHMESRTWAFLLLLLGLLIVGTLQVDLLRDSYATISLPIPGMDALEQTLSEWVPFDASRGEEGISAQGAVLIGLLILVGAAAWKGLGDIFEGYSAWTWLALGLIALTLLVAAVQIVPHAGYIDVGLTGRALGVLLGLGGLWYVGSRYYEDHELQEWLWETWRFVKQIFPLLVVGVFAVGIVRGIIRPEWIEALAGSNTVLANLAGVLFGVVMYFPTLVEVPIANMFLDLGMHRGPLLAYLMSDPELSLQSILITSSVIGKAKTWVYVAWVALFSTLAGLVYGAWVDGASIWRLATYLGAGMTVLAVGLWALGRHSARSTATEPAPAE